MREAKELSLLCGVFKLTQHFYATTAEFKREALASKKFSRWLNNIKSRKKVCVGGIRNLAREKMAVAGQARLVLIFL